MKRLCYYLKLGGSVIRKMTCKGFSLVLSIFALTVLMYSTTECAAEPKSILMKGSDPVIVYGTADKTERLAADEFARYVEQMTGVKCRISGTVGKLQEGDKVVSIGKTLLLDQAGYTVPLAVPGSLWRAKFDTSKLGKEGFLQQTVKLNNADVLLLAGGSGIGTLYSVYDYLERYCHVGFFVDGDYVPKGETLKFTGIDNVEKPPLEYRFWNTDMGHYSHMRGQTVMWQFPKWKKQIDWMAKRKLNLMNFAVPRLKKVFNLERKDKELCDSSGLPRTWTYPDEYRWETAKKVLDYSRKFGIRSEYSSAEFGWVPAEYAAKHPELKYYSSTYGGSYIYPNEPIDRKSVV